MIAVVVADAAAQDRAADGNPPVASHITRPEADMTHPAAVIDRRDIELSGMTNVGDLLLRRSVYNNFGLYRPFVLGNGRARDSRQRAPHIRFDLRSHTLPISAVERVEILSDTAAALHGGHAIGGAINIVLRRGFEGIEVQTRAGMTK